MEITNQKTHGLKEKNENELIGFTLNHFLFGAFLVVVTKVAFTMLVPGQNVGQLQ